MSGSGTPHSEWLADVLEAAESKEHEPDNPEMLMAVGVIALAVLGN